MRHLIVVLCLATAPTAAQSAESWPQFLGPLGASTASGATTLDFDRANDLRYRVELPTGESSPCIWGNQIFLTGHDGEELVMFALDRATGQEQWRHAVPAPKDSQFEHSDAGLAMPTACTNGERVFFYLPSYGLVAHQVDGTLAWEKRLPDPKPAFGIGTSPVLFGKTVFLLRDGCPDAALYALHEKTGEAVWTVPRLAFRDSHATPYLWKNRDRTELVIASTGSLVSYDPSSGSESWRVDGLTPLVCTTPTASADRLYFAGWSTTGALGADRVLAGLEEPLELTAEEREDPAALFHRFDTNGDRKIARDELPAGRMKAAYTFLDRNGDGGIAPDEWVPLLKMPARGKNLLVAIKPGGKGNVTDTHVEWSERRGIPYVSSPLLYDERLYLIKAGGILSCFDAVTGKPRFKRSRLSDHSEYYATPVGMDGHVIICSSAGTLYVLEVADELKITRTVEFDEPIFATPAVVDGTVYVRTGAALYAFARRGSSPR